MEFSIKKTILKGNCPGRGPLEYRRLAFKLDLPSNSLMQIKNT